MAAATTAAAAALSMKLLIDRKAQRVLFAEAVRDRRRDVDSHNAGELLQHTHKNSHENWKHRDEASKEVVDFLFSLLALPVATAVKLVGTDAMVGCVGNLYASVDKLDATYVQAGAAKDALLSPTVVSPAASSANSSLLRLPEPSTVKPKTTFYRCTNTSYGNCRSYITDAHGRSCPTCHCSMTTAAQYLPSAVSDGSGQTVAVAKAGEAKGFVQGIVTYTVLDDLTVAPMSAISSITLLNTFAVRDLADLQEKTVQLGYNEGLAILKASLQSKTVLTDVFLAGNKKSPARGRA
ncbi:unnamed protein product [Urochloa decumbens]|uniref:Uncharacterized protein n=1 Tax=Urochloa decumbens TaxID=240449 RepID=A0ABC9AKY1_9POAL